MKDILIIFAKYFTPILVLLYTFISFKVFGVKPLQLSETAKKKLSPNERRKRERKYEMLCKRKQQRMFSCQYMLIYFFHFLFYAILYLDKKSLSVLFLGFFELLFLIVAKQVYSIVYKNMSKLLFNNMLMLLDIGFVMIARLSYDLAIKQFIIVIIGTALCLLVPFIIDSVNAIDRFDWLYAIMGLGLLVVVLILAETKFGAKNWVKINNTSIQPSEFVKIIFVFCIASMLSKAKKLSQIIYISLLAGAHVIVLVLEKDLGAALLFFVTYFVMLYIARKNGLYIVLGSVMGILAAIVAYKIPHFSHVRVRVMAWQNPWDTAAGAGYQVAQSLFAIGTGGWFGLGLTKGLPYKVPVRESDFIFSVVCEELGVIIGIMIILICLSNYIMFINIAMQIRNLFYKLIAVGLSTMYIFQVLLTIGGAVKFIPSTGVTLPFVSYGGSSILSSLIVFSVIQGLYVRKASS